MSRLSCEGKSSKVSPKQVTLDVTSTFTETDKPGAERTKHHSDSSEVGGAKVFSDKLKRRLPVCASPLSVKGSGSTKVNVLCAGAPSKEPSPEESPTVTAESVRQPGGCDGLTAVPIQDLKMTHSHSAVAGGKARAPLQIEAIPPPEPRVEEEDDKDEGRRAPLELLAEFLKAMMGKDFPLASKLCAMILIYEPENPEARQFLPLIQEQLLEEQEEEHSNDSDDDDDDDDDSHSSDDSDSEDSGSDEEASQCSGSSSSSEDDDEKDDVQRNRHKPGPPPHLPP